MCVCVLLDYECVFLCDIILLGTDLFLDVLNYLFYILNKTKIVKQHLTFV